MLKQLSTTIGKTKVIELSKLLKVQQFALRDLIDLTFIADKDIAFRAAWILENLFLYNQLLYLDELDYLFSQVKNVEHASCQRHYVKIVMHVTGDKTDEAIKDKLKGIDLEPVIEKCFDWMIDPRVKIAVKVFAADSLFNLRSHHPWIKEELASQVKFLMRNGSPAIQFRGKKLLEKLCEFGSR